jgi:uncharacterized protein
MAEENVEIVRRLYEVAEQGDIEAAIALVDPDIEVIPPAEWIQGETLRGRDKAQDFAIDWRTAFEGFTVEAERIVDGDGDRVLVYAHDRGRIPGSTTEIDAHLFHIWTVKAGKVIRWQVLTDEARALEAAGLGGD